MLELLHMSVVELSNKIPRLTDDTFKDILTAFPDYYYCENINLSYNNITDKSAEIFALCSRAAIVNFSYNQVGDATAMAFAKNPHVHTLYLSGSSITDVGASEFLKNTTIQYLYFYNCNIAVDLQKKLWEHLNNNRKQTRMRRSIFFNNLLCIVNDRANFFSSKSMFSVLPIEILIKILESINFLELGVAKSQGVELVRFAFDHKRDIYEKLSCRQSVKIAGNQGQFFVREGMSRYRFFNKQVHEESTQKSHDVYLITPSCSIS